MICAGKSELEIFGQSPKQSVVNSGFFVDFQPSAGLDPKTTSIEFDIKGSETDYLDLNDSILYIRFKVTNSDGTAIDDNSAVKPTNYMLNAMFTDVVLSLNGVVIEGGGQMYPYKATIESIFNFNEDAKRLQLLPAGFSDDENERGKWIEKSKLHELAGALRLDFFNQPKYLIPRVDVHLELKVNKSSFILIKTDADPAVDPIIQLAQATLYARRVRVDPAVSLGHDIGLRNKNACYAFSRGEVRSATIAAKSHFFTKDNVFGHTVIPKFVVVGMVKSSAYTGDYKEAPFNFEHFNLGSIGLYRDGQAIPFRDIYQTDFDKRLFTKTYVQSIISNTQHLNTNLNNGISMDDFKNNGYALFTFNLAPDYDIHNRQSIADGNLRLDIKFRKMTAVAINVIIYGLFDDEIQITKDRAVIKGL